MRPASLLPFTVALACAAPAPLGPMADGAARDGGGAPAGDSAAPAVRSDAGAPPSNEVPACALDLSPELTSLHVPGLSVGVLSRGRLACVSVAGLADVEAGRPVTPDTAFLWASVSKTITATAAMMLVEQGDLGLDDDVSRYLPFEVQNPRCAERPVTVRQLLTHTSSIRDDDEVYADAYTVGDSPRPLGDFLEDYLTPGGDLYDARASYAGECPAESVEYSNIAVGLLGYVVERVAAAPFDAFCRARIFAPLAMAPASFRLAGLDEDALARPHEASPTGFVALPHTDSPTYPDGSIRASVPAMARFLEMFVAGGARGEARLLDEATVREMGRPQVPELDEAQGFLWFTQDGLTGHDGSDDGASALMFFDPADGDGALIVANGEWDDDEAWRLLRRLIAL